MHQISETSRWWEEEKVLTLVVSVRGNAVSTLRIMKNVNKGTTVALEFKQCSQNPIETLIKYEANVLKLASIIYLKVVDDILEE